MQNGPLRGNEKRQIKSAVLRSIKSLDFCEGKEEPEGRKNLLCNFEKQEHEEREER